MPANFGTWLAAFGRTLAAAWWRHKLAGAETELGRIGWQTCDFGTDCDDLLRRLDAAERRQIDLVNQRAASARETTALEAGISAAKSGHDAALRELGAVEERFSQAAARLAADLDEAQKKSARFRIAVAALDEELTSTARAGRRARPEWQVLIELSESKARLDDEERTAAQLEAELNLAAHARDHDAAEPAKNARDAAERLASLNARLHDVRRTHASTERAILKAERTKSVPFRRLGAIMADAGLAPPNQPAALDAVLELRQKISPQPHDQTHS